MAVPPPCPPPAASFTSGAAGGGGGGCLSRSQIKMRQRNAFRVTPKLSSQNRGPRRSGHRDEGDTGTGAGRGGDTRAPGAGGRRRHRLRPSDARPGLAAIAPELRGMNGAAVGSVGTAAGAEGRRRGGGGGCPASAWGTRCPGGAAVTGGVSQDPALPRLFCLLPLNFLFGTCQKGPQKNTHPPHPPRVAINPLAGGCRPRGSGCRSPPPLPSPLLELGVKKGGQPWSPSPGSITSSQCSLRCHLPPKPPVQPPPQPLPTPAPPGTGSPSSASPVTFAFASGDALKKKKN